MVFAVLWVIVAVVGAAMVVGHAARLGWWCEWASHFRVQYACALVVCAIAFLVGQAWWQAGLAGGLAAVNLWAMLPLYRGSIVAASSETATMRILLANVQFSNTATEPLRRLLQREAPDVVALLELTPHWLEAAASWLDADYPFSKRATRTDGWGIGLWSRLPLDHVELAAIGSSRLPSIIARVLVNQQPLTVIATHPYAPTSRRRSDLRNEQLAALAQLVRAQEGLVMLVGDLNITRWSPYFADLLRVGRLRDSQEGFGVQVSWPSMIPLMGVMIDHCLVSSGLLVSDRRVGPPTGSDHRPILVDVALEQPAPAMAKT